MISGRLKRKSVVCIFSPVFHSQSLTDIPDPTERKASTFFLQLYDLSVQVAPTSISMFQLAWQDKPGGLSLLQAEKQLADSQPAEPFNIIVTKSLWEWSFI